MLESINQPIARLGEWADGDHWGSIHSIFDHAVNVRFMLDGAEQLSSGRRSRNVVSHWDCLFHERFTPQIRLFNGSEPMSTFEVSGFSVSDIIVPPKVR